jgi:hypothetical protein
MIHSFKMISEWEEVRRHNPSSEEEEEREEEESCEGVK